MSKRINIPASWWPYYQNPAHFVTYYGDIYHGRIIEHQEHPDRFFILSNNQSIEFRELKPQERTLENYQRLGWEIRDLKIIRDVLPDTFIGRDAESPSSSREGNQVWKKAFVFGAGASAFCVTGKGKDQFQNFTFRPPTAFDIFDERFDELIDKYPGLRPVIPRYERMKRNIEECMENDWEAIRHSFNPVILSQHIQIQFYLQEQFREISNRVVKEFNRHNLYADFAGMLQRHLGKNSTERVGIISFNYDTILDQFLGENKLLDLHGLQGYSDWNNRQVMLFKPHGSCNWGWRVENSDYKTAFKGRFSDWLYQGDKMLSDVYFDILGKPWLTVNNRSWGIEASHNKDRKGRYTLDKNLIDTILPGQKGHYFPALLLPYRDKDEFVMPLEQQHQMKWFLSEVEELFVIGWKGNEDLFNRILKSNTDRLKKLIIVNPERDAVLENLKPFLGNKKYEVEHYDYFEDFVNTNLETYLEA